MGKCWRGDGRAGEGEGIEYQAEKEVTPRKCGVEELENTRLHYNADSNYTRQKKRIRSADGGRIKMGVKGGVL